LQKVAFYHSNLTDSFILSGFDPLKDRKLPYITPEVFVSTPETKVHIHRGVQARIYRKVLSKVYTPNLKDPVEEIVFQNLWPHSQKKCPSL
jgi:hypothetical protein